MAEDEAPEITSEENPIEEHELELCLGFRPIHPRPATSQNFPQFSDPDPNPTASLREAQAFRRQEAKRKRELKRKATGSKERRACDSPAAEDDGICRKEAKLYGACSAPAGWWGCNGFRPYQGQNGKITSVWQNVEGENRQSISSGSSSGISDNYQTNSGPGGTSSDVGSHSSRPYSQPSPPAIPAANPLQVQQNGSTPSHLQQSCQHPKSPPSTNSHSQTSVESGPLSEKGRVPTTQTSTNGKVEIGKPPKPKRPTANQQKQMVAQMPCVSVTGNGPNGKTITGFLYRYTTAEVSIVCVCHGASFSPAGFVEHAGGVDVEHPLRHIRVVPFALG